MAKSVTILITGDKQVNRMLRQLSGADGKKVVRKAARAGVKVVLPTARRNAPRRSGRIARSFKVRALKRSRTRIGARITIGNENFTGETFYGGFQEWGWKIGKRAGRSAMQLAARRKVEGKFFLKKATDNKRKSALTVYRREIERGVREIARRNGAR